MSAEVELPLEADGFVRLMAPFAPFEVCPELAVGVSGGRDSMALALLAHDWAGGRGGKASALIVDHGLRPGSADEAAITLRRLAERGIAGWILAWSGPKPRTGLQEAARAARYRLLRAACQDRGILHLLVAHHADDQAETVAMRAARQSGIDGLVGMAAQVEFPEVRVLRPLLMVSRERLTATLVARGMKWIDDPSNTDPRFERARLRLSCSSPVIGGGGPVGRRGEAAVEILPTPTSESEMTCLRPSPSAPYDGAPPPMTGEEMRGEARSRRERRLARAAVEVVEVDEAGQPAIDLAGFARLDAALQIGLLSRLVQRVGGRDHPPRRDRLERAVGRIAAATDRGKSGRGEDFTLSQCRLMLRQVPASRRLRWLVRAENGGIAAQPLVPAAFFACGAGSTAHLDYRLLTTECAREPVQS